MSEIFISHSSLNNDSAIKVKDWLVKNGWGPSQIFLDIDDLGAGDRWRNRLNEIGATCEAVIICLSDEWIRSPECVREFVHAEGRGKPIFPVSINEITERIPSFITALQIADVTFENENSGFDNLHKGLVSARIGPKHFPWPPNDDPNRAPYRGLKALEKKDAAVFFGRNTAITKGLNELRRMKQNTTERMFVILGASGSGKSSFLKAGLLSRLSRERESYNVLNVMRPENAAITGALGLNNSLKDYAKHDTTNGSLLSPTQILPIDQGEELFNPEDPEGRNALEQMCKLLKVDSNLIVIITIRSDSYDQLQNQLHKNEIEPLLFNLPTLSPGAFKEVIVGPGQLVTPNIVFEEALVDKLIDDLGSNNALPLLAFAIEQLVNKFAGDNLLELSEYTDGLRGLSGAVNTAFEIAFDLAIKDPYLPNDRNEIEDLARQTFIPWLVQIDSNAMMPKRRRSLLNELPNDSKKLMEYLINQRLLFVDTRIVDGSQEVYVEVTHESVLRFWPLLNNWLENETTNIILRDNILVSAKDWESNDKASDWLIHKGNRLASAMKLMSNHMYSDHFSNDMKDYLKACEGNQNGADTKEYNQKLNLIKDELGEDIFDKLTKLGEERNKSDQWFADTSVIEDDIQVRKNKLLDAPNWHSEPANHIGSTGPQRNYTEVWEFPCCRKQIYMDAQPSQERADGCKKMPS